MTKISITHSEGGVRGTETGEVAAEGCDITRIAAIAITHAGSEVDLLLERPGGELDTRKSMKMTRQWKVGGHATATYSIELVA